MPECSINGVSLQGIEAAMLAIDWQGSKNGSVFRFSDEATWAREKSIDALMSELLKLSAIEEGKFYADALKLRFWSGTLMEQITGNLTAVRNRLEVSERFYFLQSGGIGVEEAYRFLLNQWIQKRMLAKGKAAETELNEADASVGEAHEKKLVKKRRVGRTRKLL